MYKSALGVAGFVVISAGDGIEALRRIDLDGPDVLVLDLGLPRLRGYDVQRELAAHADTRAIPIVVVTGSDNAEVDEADFSCVLRKPIDPEDLVRAVRRCLQSR